jgi:subtilase family serine protease
MRHHLTLEILENRLVPSAGGFGRVFAIGVTNPNPSGYTPAQIRHAYGFDQVPSLVTNGYNTAGQGQTIAIVMAGDQPNIASDLHVFDQTMNIPDPTLIKMNEYGSTSGPWPQVNQSWAGEISLDVEWAHAIAPAAKIVLVESYSPNINDLVKAIDTARNYPGVVAVSMSWGLSEGAAELNYDGHLTTPAGHTPVTFVACTLDNGTSYPNTLYWPAVSPNVLSVGGTSLTLNADNSYNSETAWSQSTGGISRYEKQPAYQQGVVTQSTTNRAVPDVAYHADNTVNGFAMYDTVGYFGQTGWFNAGGDSFGAPQWAALVAIADQQRAAGGLAALDGPSQTLPDLYQLYRSNPGLYFHDITSGANGKYSAGAGFDLVTGMGTPKADQLIPALASYGNHQSRDSATVAAPVGNGTSGAGLGQRELFDILVALRRKHAQDGWDDGSGLTW